MTQIVHVTTVHPRYDTRIFHKMCVSLADSGYNVTLVVADGKGNETSKGVSILDIGEFQGRFNRIIYAPRRAFREAFKLDAAIYHLHDPELIPIGLKLKRVGKTVIFDSHEDIPLQLLGKPYLAPPISRMLSVVYKLFERIACSRFDAIIAATPFIREKFRRINSTTVDINNFPLLGELTAPSQEPKKRSIVCYVGSIAAIRGIREMVHAMDYVRSDIRLEVAGIFSEPALRDEVCKHPGWQQIDELGFVTREDVRDLLARSMMGLVTLHPVINYIDALPVKMFEYMSAGVPVIASDFPLWQEIIEGNDCGVCVNPLDPAAIAAAIDTIVENSDRAREMGQNGQKAVLKKFNWGVEEKKLLKVYKNLLAEKH